MFKPLTTADEWVALLEESKDHPVVVYKHSSTCPISAGAKRRLRKGIDKGVLGMPIHALVVQDSPELKAQIAQDLDVQHESPQIIVIQDGKAVYHDSHKAVTAEDLAKSLE